MRFVARAALGGWLLPLFFALFASLSAAPAQAQAPIQTVVVLDFAVAGGLDPLLGRKAADGLAVELQRSGDFEVVTRQRVEEAVGQQAGLQPPFNDTAQIRLAQAVGARSVFSGRVAGVSVDPGRSARVALEVRQLDAGTGDYINGTQVSESTEQKLQAIANEILVDEAINKATFSASRSIRQTALPVGNVLNTSREEIELSIGTRDGAAVGQRYSVLRDVFNTAKQVTERRKIGEVTVIRVESDQSTARLSAGGAEGIRTNDRVRKIFVANNYPLAAVTANGNSVTPVTAPPIQASGSSSPIKKVAKEGGRGLLGLLALAGLVGLVGAGGGGGGSSSSGPRVDQPVLANPSADYPQATLTFTAGFSGFNFNQSLQGESVVGYMIFRGTSPGFAADINTLQAFVDGRNNSSSNQRVTFSDPPLATRRRVEITASDADTGAQGGSVDVTDSIITTGADTITENQTQITLDFTQRPAIIGQTYFYRVGRITAERVRQNTNDGTTTTTTVQLLPVRSRVSKPTGGFTPLLRPQVVPSVTGFNTDNFTVRVNYDPQPFDATFNFLLPLGVNVATGADQFRVQVSTSTSFSDLTTFTSSDLPPTSTTANADQVFNLGNIRIPDNNNSYVPGLTPLFVRVLSRNSTDAVPTFRISRTLAIGTALGSDSVTASRFLAAPSSQSGGGVNIGRRPGRLGAAGSVYAPPRVMAPR